MWRSLLGLFLLCLLAVLMTASTLVASHIQVPWMDPLWVARSNLRTARAVVIAIDTSGSIQEANRLPLEKTLAIGVINVLLMQNFQNPVIAVYAFNADIQYVIPPTRLSNLDLNQVIAAINGIQDTPNLTWLNGAIDEACNITWPVRPDGTLVLITDGIPTTPCRNCSWNVSAAMTATLAAAQNFKNNCSTLAVIGIDLDAEAEEFLRDIASPGALLPAVSTGAGEDFETCDFSRFPWETGGHADWFVTSDEAHSGHCSAQAGYIGNYGRTYLGLTTEVTGTSISFWYKVSSESGGDYLCFYIDGHAVDCWSGEIDWSLATYPIHPGTYTLSWEYIKDSSWSYGYDTAWIDDVSFGEGVGACLEPNDDSKSACLISLPFSGRFAIETRGDRDFFRFSLDYYAVVSIEIYAGRLGSGLDSYLCLYDAHGYTITCNDDYHGPDSFISVPLSSGQYFIEVGPYSGTGPYELRVEARRGH